LPAECSHQKCERKQQKQKEQNEFHGDGHEASLSINERYI
jgi:hypothetical protein